MTVKELISELLEFDKDEEVYVSLGENNIAELEGINNWHGTPHLLFTDWTKKRPKQEDVVVDILQSKVPAVESRMTAVRSLKAWNAVRDEIKRNNIVEERPAKDMIPTSIALGIINKHLNEDVKDDSKRCWI